MQKSHLQSFLFVFFINSIFLLTTINSTTAACRYDKLIEGETVEIGVLLTWSTEIEENNSMFIIEKSVNGIVFSELGTVEGAGNSFKIKDYNFLDVMASQGKAFYRLRQIDFDGSFSYSEVLPIHRKTPNQFMVVRMSAIAAVDNFDITIDAFENGELSYHLQSDKGTIIQSEKIKMVSGLNFLSINLKDQKAGIYKLVLNVGAEKEVLTFKKIQDKSMMRPLATSKKMH